MKKAMAALILFLMETLLFYLYEMPLEAWAYSSVFILLIFGGWIILDGVHDSVEDLTKLLRQKLR